MAISATATREAISKAVAKELVRVYEAQLDIVNKDKLIKSGHLKAVLEEQRYTFSKGGYTLQSINKIPLYLRFLDMKEKGNHKIYNRVVYGIIGKELFREIKYGVLQDSIQLIAQDLKVRL